LEPAYFKPASGFVLHLDHIRPVQVGEDTRLLCLVVGDEGVIVV
jgi:hypothetical protein